MKFNIFKKCIDRLPKEVNIHFSGFSEPFLNKDCSKMILYAYEHNHNIRIYTTTEGMNLKDIDLIKNIPFTRFILHVPGKEGGANLIPDQKYLNLLKKLFSSKISNLSYTCPGSKGLEEVHPLLKKLLIEFKISTEGWGVKTRAGNIEVKDIENPKKNLEIIPECGRLTRNELLPNGDVVLCCQDWGLKHIIGNLLNSNYKDLFLNKEYLNIKKGLRDNKSEILCRYCDEIEI